MADHWRQSTLGEVAQVVGGGTPSTKEPTYWGGDIPWLTPTEVVRADGQTIRSSDRTITSLGLAKSSAHLLPAGVVLLTTRASVGFTAISAVPLATNQGFQSLIPGDGLDPAFLMMWIQANREEFRSRAGGSTFPEISKDKVRQIPITVPPLQVQRQIVDLIGAVDEHVLRLEQEQRALDRLWWGVAAALESATSSVASMPLGQLAEISGGLTKNKNTALVGVPVVVPYLRVANVHRRFVDLADLATITTTTDVVERLRLKPGDVLLNEGGDKDKLGRGAVWSGQVENCIHQNHVFRARITDDRFNAEFVSAWANSFGQRWFETYGTQTTGIASISKTTLSKFPVPVLPKDEQMRWAAALDGVFEVMTRLAAEAKVLRGLRARILDGLLSGEAELTDAYDRLVDAGVA